MSKELQNASESVWLWKTPQMQGAAVAVAKSLAGAECCVWTDEVEFPGLGPEDRNVIGLAWRTLQRRGLIGKTGNWRPSKAKSRRGGVAWQYRVASWPLLKEFLRRNNAPVEERQGELL